MLIILEILFFFNLEKFQIDFFVKSLLTLFIWILNKNNWIFSPLLQMKNIFTVGNSENIKKQ